MNRFRSGLARVIWVCILWFGFGSHPPPPARRWLSIGSLTVFVLFGSIPAICSGLVFGSKGSFMPVVFCHRVLVDVPPFVVKQCPWGTV
ncbi:hypothetical protein L195_g041571 [Trifolium pratense]|uniref:Uncharacterized protein n=1 Tax=Trifolium pratense TaxID=57577 RepID=A0A2K3M3Y8_TRIPR|nr:hypothetical protein L195_g041571 [Trifolium pratense]